MARLQRIVILEHIQQLLVPHPNPFAFVVLVELRVLDDENGGPDDELVLGIGVVVEALPLAEDALHDLDAGGAGAPDAKLLLEDLSEFAVQLDAAGAHGARVGSQGREPAEPVDGARAALAGRAVPLAVVLVQLAVVHAVQVLEEVAEPLDLLLLLVALLRVGVVTEEGVVAVVLHMVQVRALAVRVRARWVVTHLNTSPVAIAPRRCPGALMPSVPARSPSSAPRRALGRASALHLRPPALRAPVAAHLPPSGIAPPLLSLGRATPGAPASAPPWGSPPSSRPASLCGVLLPVHPALARLHLRERAGAVGGRVEGRLAVAVVAIASVVGRLQLPAVHRVVPSVQRLRRPWIRAPLRRASVCASGTRHCDRCSLLTVDRGYSGRQIWSSTGSN